MKRSSLTVKLDAICGKLLKQNSVKYYFHQNLPYELPTIIHIVLKISCAEGENRDFVRTCSRTEIIGRQLLRDESNTQQTR